MRENRVCETLKQEQRHRKHHQIDQVEAEHFVADDNQNQTSFKIKKLKTIKLAFDDKNFKFKSAIAEQKKTWSYCFSDMHII